MFPFLTHGSLVSLVAVWSSLTVRSVMMYMRIRMQWDHASSNLDEDNKINEMMEFANIYLVTLNPCIQAGPWIQAGPQIQAGFRKLA